MILRKNEDQSELDLNLETGVQVRLIIERDEDIEESIPESFWAECTEQAEDGTWEASFVHDLFHHPELDAGEGLTFSSTNVFETRPG